MPSLLTARRRARPSSRRNLRLRGALATDTRFIVGATGAQAAPHQVAYLTLHPDGSASLDTDNVVPDGFGVPWSFEDDGTIRIPVGCAPMELDVHAVRQVLCPGTPVSEFLRLRRDRPLVAGSVESTTHRCARREMTACADAALWTDDMVRRQEFSTGRIVRFADDVLSPTMFCVPDAVTPSTLKILAAKAEKRYAKASIQLLGVLPWLQAHIADKQPAAPDR